MSAPQQRGDGRFSEALALYRAGQGDQAARLCQALLASDPVHTDALHLLGLIAFRSGRYDAAVAWLEKAAAGAAPGAGLLNNLGNALRAQGRLDEAVAAWRRAVACDPDHAGAQHGLGNGLRAQGDRHGAVAAYRRALALEPRRIEARYDLAVALFRDDDPDPAAVAFAEVLEADPAHRRARFHLGVLCDLRGDRRAADAQFAGLPEDAAHLLESWRYAKQRRSPATRFFASSAETLRFALAEAKVSGLALEFGVLFGTSINLIARHHDGLVHGFDSFAGLPEAWGSSPPGAYSTGGRLPTVADNVRLHVGLFTDSLPSFLACHEGPLRFVNVDCDLYSATKTVLDGLAERVVTGSVLAFDEYLCTPHWREDEFSAFQEAAARNRWRYDYLAFNLFTRQAVVRIA